MRRIYLIRHGQPFFPNGEGYCIGSTDFPLSPLGKLQACVLGHALKGEKLTVFSSPLTRAYDTASFISPAPVVLEELREMHAGDWDGLSFREISQRWPELFEARAYNKELSIPGCEDWYEGQRRFMEGVEKALSMCEGDIAIVAHTTVILSLICHVMGSEEYKDFSYRQSCGSWYMMELDEKGLHCKFPWQSPRPDMDDDLCHALMDAIALPEHIRAHCKAVAAEAGRIASRLKMAGLELDTSLIRKAALLHDIARQQDEHPRIGADWLLELGYEGIANIIRQHHELESNDINEAAVVYIADKICAETEAVSLRTRFEKSREKCHSAEALAAHEKRMAQALDIAAKINALCKMEVIK